MNIKQFVGNLFLGSKAFDQASQQFHAVDQERLVKDLEIEARAKMLGEKNLPNPNAKRKDEIARDIDTYLGETLRHGRDDVTDHFKAAVALDTYQSVEKEMTELKNEMHETLNDLYTTCKNGVNVLFPIKKDVTDGELDLEKFRTKNGLSAPADYPENQNRAFAWIFLAFTLESLFNAAVLGDVHRGGYKEALLETFVIAGLNVSVGFTAGWYFWRQTKHRLLTPKYAGIAGVFCLFVLIFLFNFLVGHYRDALSQIYIQGENLTVLKFEALFAKIFSKAIEYALTQPWDFGAVMSVLLSLVGIGTAIFAAVKGFYYDDPYPNYGPKTRSQEERSQHYAEQFEELQNKLTRISDDARGKIKGIFENAESAQENSLYRKKNCEALISKYEGWVETISLIGEAVYARYRSINEQYRTKATPPAFEIAYDPPKKLAVIPNSPDAADLGNLEDIRNLMDLCSKEINGAQNNYLGVYKTIGVLAPMDAKAKRQTSFDEEVENINQKIQAGLRAKDLARD